MSATRYDLGLAYGRSVRDVFRSFEEAVAYAPSIDIPFVQGIYDGFCRTATAPNVGATMPREGV